MPARLKKRRRVENISDFKSQKQKGDNMTLFGWTIVRQEVIDGLMEQLEKESGALVQAEKQLEAEREALAHDVKRLDMIAQAGPLKREQILEGLSRGPEDGPIKSVLAIMRGLREATVGALASVNTRQDVAAVLRGKLGMANEFEQMLVACWGDLERTRKATEKNGE
jgi:hypothetical protein